MKIRSEINLMAGLLSAASGVSADAKTAVTINQSVLNPPGDLYFEVTTRSTAAIAYNVLLMRQDLGTTVYSIGIPSGTTSWTTFRIPLTNSLLNISNTLLYTVGLSNESGATKLVKSAKIVIYQGEGEIISNMFQFEIGNSETGKTNTTSSPLTNPKYWFYNSSSYDGDTYFTASVNWLTSTTKNTCTITLQEDNGSFGSWTDKVTIVNAGSNTALQNSLVTFTPTHGRNYRIASLGSTTKSTYDIKLAKILVYQTSSLTQSYELTNLSWYTTSSLKAYYRFENNLNDSKGSVNLYENGGGISYDTGLFGNCVKFPSFNSHSAKISSSYALDNFEIHDLLVDELTVSCWFKMIRDDYIPPFNNQTPLIVNIEDTTGGIYGVHYRSGSIIPYVNGTGFTSATSFLAGTSSWHHVAITTGTGSTGGVRFYYNGVFTSLVSKVSIPLAYSGSIGINLGNTSNRGLSANIDEVCIFKGRLSDTQVRSLYIDQLTKFETQYLIANTNFSSSGTNAQEYYTSWSLNDWSGVDNLYYHEANSVAAGTSDIKLIKQQGPNDITNSTLTDVIERERSSVMTMPTSSDLIDVQATSNSGNLNASRIIVLSTKSVVTGSNPPYQSRFFSILGDDKVVRNL